MTCKPFQNDLSRDTFYMFCLLLGTREHHRNVPINHIYNISYLSLGIPLCASARIVTSLKENLEFAYSKKIWNRRIGAVLWDRPRVQNFAVGVNKRLHDLWNTGQYRYRPIIVTIGWWGSLEQWCYPGYLQDRWKLTCEKRLIEKVRQTLRNVRCC